MDKPHLLTVCVVGDGESETGCVRTSCFCCEELPPDCLRDCAKGRLQPLGMVTSTSTLPKAARSFLFST